MRRCSGGGAVVRRHWNGSRVSSGKPPGDPPLSVVDSSPLCVEPGTFVLPVVGRHPRLVGSSPAGVPRRCIGRALAVLPPLFAATPHPRRRLCFLFSPPPTLDQQRHRQPLSSLTLRSLLHSLLFILACPFGLRHSFRVHYAPSATLVFLSTSYLTYTPSTNLVLTATTAKPNTLYFAQVRQQYNWIVRKGHNPI
jgi:hypothetical protein